MYVILTSKVGEFRTEPEAGLAPVESWDYLFCGRKKARFVIAEFDGDARIRIEDETPPPVVNRISTKFLQKFRTVEDARRELEELARFGGESFVLSRTDHRAPPEPWELP
ncbi:MAG TPA: ferredoxin [Rhodocyclaceae bacterium]|nr:ferredoxin [Rhodocyclaceae bacterium]